MLTTLIMAASLSVGAMDYDAHPFPVLGAPVRVTERILEVKPARRAVVGVARAVNKARPVRRLLNVQPVRRIVKARPVRRLLFPRCR